MRPNCVVAATDKQGRVLLYGLYYSSSKASRAYRKFKTPSPDGFHMLLREDGSSKAIPPSDDLRFWVSGIPQGIPTKREPWKESFFDTTDEEFNEIAGHGIVPVEIIKEIAKYEKAYVENKCNTRWDAWKRAYLPSFLFKWI